MSRSLRMRLLGTLAPAALLLGGCAAGSTTSATVPTTAGSPWGVVAAGSATPSPTPSLVTATPTMALTGFLPIASTGAMPTPSLSPSCVPKQHGTINYAGAVPAKTSAVVRWYNAGGPDLVQYRLTAISQNLKTGQQRDIGWTVVTPGALCGFMTATVTGLDPTTYYVFSVDAVRTRRGVDGTTAETVARSEPIRTK